MKNNFIILFILFLFGISCQKESSEIETGDVPVEINYGNLTGKIAFVHSTEQDKIIIIDFNKRQAITLLSKENTIISEGIVSLSSDGEKIAYSDNYQIITMLCNGKNYRQLTPTNQIGGLINNSFPVWSNDCSKIFYVSIGSINGGPVYSINTDGKNNSQITDFIIRSKFSISNDGNYLAVALKDNVDYPNDGIYLYDIGKKTLRQIVNLDNSLTGYCPVFSPDNKKIAYVKTHWLSDGNSGPYYFKIVTINTDGTGEQTILTIPEVHRYKVYVTWSPDGTKLAFNSGGEQGGVNDNIYVVNSDGTGLIQISYGDGYAVSPSWVK